MAKSRSAIRSELRNDLRIDPNGKVWSDDQLNQLIHEGEIEVARRLKPKELEGATTFSTAIGDREYLFSTIAPSLLQVISVIYDYETVVFYTASTLAFTGSTITDSANGFVAAGFTAGMKLQVENSTSNDGTDHLTISTVAAGTLTLTSAVTAEVAGTSISLVGRSNPDNTRTLQKAEDIREFDPLPTTLGYPTRYVASNNSLVFDVLPKEVDTVQIRQVKLPTEMSADGTNSELPDELIPLVRKWAQYLAWDSIPGGEETGTSQKALQHFEREIRRKITLYNLDDYSLRQYKTSNFRRR